jgi:hypothetical protein
MVEARREEARLCERCGQPAQELDASGRAFVRAIEERVVERLRGELRGVFAEEMKAVREAVHDDIKPIREALDRELPVMRQFVEVEMRTERHRKTLAGMKLRSVRRK